MARANHPSDRSVAEVAWPYCTKGLNQAEKAKRLNLSRPTVITDLRLAREHQIVGVKIAGVHFRVKDLADALCETYGLQSTYVVPEAESAVKTTYQV